MSIPCKLIGDDKRDGTMGGCEYHDDGRQHRVVLLAHGDITAQQMFDRGLVGDYRRTSLALIKKGLIGDEFGASATLCPDCNECAPVRINLDKFKSSRGQKRTLAAFENLDARRIALAPEETLPHHDDMFELHHKYLLTRFPNTVRETFNNDHMIGEIFTGTDILLIRDKADTLLSFAIINRDDEDANMLFLSYDPDYQEYYPGVVTMLNTIEWAQNQGVKNLYLGPTNQTGPLAYKQRYSGLETFDGDEWVDYNPETHTEGPDYKVILHKLGISEP